MDEKRLVDGTTALAEKQPRVIKIEPAERPQNVRLRVAAYTRVSSDSEDQLNSFAAQNRYYTELISSKAEWRMVDIYPKLIDEDQLIAANEKRSNKPQLPKKTEAQKVLRRLCGTPLSERVEQSVTDLLNGLANCPERIQHQRSPTPATHSKTQEALDNALEQQPIDEDNAKTLILRLAAEQYAALGNEEYETNRLRRLFSAFECVAELNADLLKSTVSEVLVTRQNVKLRLKNRQIIERSDLQ